MERTMYKNILLPIDLADPNLAKPALDTAVMMADSQDGAIRLINVLPMKSAEEALTTIAGEIGIDRSRVSSIVRQGGIYHEILEEAKAMKADLIVMSSHRVGVRTYFLGSNAGHVVRYAACSVLVVRQSPG